MVSSKVEVLILGPLIFLGRLASSEEEEEEEGEGDGPRINGVGSVIA